MSADRVPVRVACAVDAAISFVADECLPTLEMIKAPPETVTFTFEGRRIIWRENGTENYPTVEIEARDPDDTREEHEITLRFLSVLSFRTETAISVVHGWIAMPTADPDHAILIVPRRPGALRSSLMSLEQPQDGDASLAIALWREAKSTRSPFFALLGFWKVLELVLADDAIEGWLKSNARDEEERNLAFDARDYYRDAVAHAERHRNSRVVANPDRPYDIRRMQTARWWLESKAHRAIVERWPQPW